MGAGGWNKGIKNSTGGGFKGKKHNQDSITKLKNRPKEIYQKPKAIEVNTSELCNYGCGQVAKYKFANGKLCCSTSHNSCPKKRQNFSDANGHKDRAAKSLETRLKNGITKLSRAKARETMIKNGTYEVLRQKSQAAWAKKPWQNNLQCPLIAYKNTKLNYQGSFEFNFLQTLENLHGIEWVENNVRRGPTVWYVDPTSQVKRLYISDFLIDNTVYEIKSFWTWNKHGKDLSLEQKNKAKLMACKEQGYNVMLVLNGEIIDASNLD